MISSESGFSVVRRIGTTTSIASKPSSSSPLLLQISPPSPLSCLFPPPPHVHLPPHPPFPPSSVSIKAQSAFLSAVEVQRLPGTHIVHWISFTLRELGGDRTSVKSTSLQDLALARRARPEFGEGLSVALATERLAGFPLPALRFLLPSLLLATLQLLLHRGNR